MSYTPVFYLKAKRNKKETLPLNERVTIMGRAENKESTPLTGRKGKPFLLSTMTVIQFLQCVFQHFRKEFTLNK